jgi:5S rRNA maturation endonuclease (ribonuclease M5)
VDLDIFGVSKDPTSSELYSEVYAMMIGENDRFREMYQQLRGRINENTRPLVITEGKTDVKHLRKAMSALNIATCDVEFYDIEEDWGDSKLKVLIEQLAKVPHQRKVIGVFDRDVQGIVIEIERDGQAFKSYGNNVYAFCIPVPPGREPERPISIEFYYSDQELKKQKNGKRLYFDNEVAVLRPASNGKAKKLVKLDAARAEEDANKKIFDQDIGAADWIHSKAVFADLIETDIEFMQEFNFEAFKLIFNKIENILQE